MDNGCSRYGSEIPKALLGDLDQERQKDLERHLAQCAACADEYALLEATVGALRGVRDVPVPRHFFVQAEERPNTPWTLFRSLGPAWQFSLAALAVLFGIVGVLAATQLQVHAGKGTLTVAFGQLPPPVPTAQAAPGPAIDVDSLRADIIGVLEARNRSEKLEWVRAIRAEMARIGTGLNEQNRLALDTALTGLEARIDNRVASMAQVIQANTDRSLDGLYRTVTLDREQDTATLAARINRFALAAEAKGTQTDAVLDTLIQVADLKLR